jgi:hypothetical protein
MKICYLILLHHKFDQAQRLVRRLAAPETGFVFHIDRAADREQAAAFRASLQEIRPVQYARPVRARWGSYTQALAIVHTILAAVRSMEPFDRYVLLSGQDYPIAPRHKIVEFFSNNAGAEFLEAFPRDLADADTPGWSPYYRFRRYHVWIGKRRVVLPLLRKGPPPLPIFHGSTWWALSRDAVVHIAEQFASNRKLKRYLRRGFLVDEVYIPSVLMASRFSAKITGNNVTYAEWTPTSGPHPKTLLIDDLEKLLASPKLFARKFDVAIDEKVMNELDALHS